MSKVVLVMDDPMYCANCMVAQRRKRFDKKDEYFWTCGKGYNRKRSDYVWNSVDMESKNKPEWCPLKAIPEKELLWFDDDRDDYNRGWNACIDEILEDNEGWTAMVESDSL